MFSEAERFERTGWRFLQSSMHCPNSNWTLSNLRSSRVTLTDKSGWYVLPHYVQWREFIVWIGRVGVEEECHLVQVGGWLEVSTEQHIQCTATVWKRLTSKGLGTWNIATCRTSYNKLKLERCSLSTLISNPRNCSLLHIIDLAKSYDFGTKICLKDLT